MMHFWVRFCEILTRSLLAIITYTHVFRCRILVVNCKWTCAHFMRFSDYVYTDVAIYISHWCWYIFISSYMHIGCKFPVVHTNKSFCIKSCIISRDNDITIAPKSAHYTQQHETTLLGIDPSTSLLKFLSTIYPLGQGTIMMLRTM